MRNLVPQLVNLQLGSSCGSMYYFFSLVSNIHRRVLLSYPFHDIVIEISVRRKEDQHLLKSGINALKGTLVALKT